MLFGCPFIGKNHSLVQKKTSLERSSTSSTFIISKNSQNSTSESGIFWVKSSTHSKKEMISWKNFHISPTSILPEMLGRFGRIPLYLLGCRHVTSLTKNSHYHQCLIHPNDITVYFHVNKDNSFSNFEPPKLHLDTQRSRYFFVWPRSIQGNVDKAPFVVNLIQGLFPDDSTLDCG